MTKHSAQRQLKVGVGVLVWGMLGAAIACGQTNSEIFAHFTFNFNNPGARATALGGAFISLADDATAAEANPAGLTALVRPEFSFECKALRFTRTVDNFSHTGTAAQYSLVGKDFTSHVISPSFASVVVPVGKLTFSAFRHELVNFESSFYTRGSYVPPLTDGSTFYPVSASLEMSVVNYGIAAAMKVSRQVSVGVSAGLSQMNASSLLTRYGVEVFNPSTVLSEDAIDDAAFDFMINAGVLWRPTQRLSIGATFKRRPSFSLEQRFRFISSWRDSVMNRRVNFHVPSSAGVGISYRATDELTFAVDAQRVFYSSLTRDFVTTYSLENTAPGDYTVDDGMEFHAGAEYIFFVSSVGVALRGGAYVEPDSRIRFDGVVRDSNDPDRIFARQLAAALYKKGEATVHAAFGIGLVLSQRLQVDFAGTIAKGVDEAVGSFVIRF